MARPSKSMPFSVEFRRRPPSSLKTASMRHIGTAAKPRFLPSASSYGPANTAHKRRLIPYYSRKPSVVLIVGGGTLLSHRDRMCFGFFELHRHADARRLSKLSPACSSALQPRMRSGRVGARSARKRSAAGEPQRLCHRRCYACVTSRGRRTAFYGGEGYYGTEGGR